MVCVRSKRSIKGDDLVVSIAIISALGGFLFGADVVLAALAVPYIRLGDEGFLDAETTVGKAVVVGSAKVVAVLGVFMGGVLAHAKGRTFAIRMTSLSYIVGPICSSVARNFGEFMVGRAFVGLAIGSSAIVVPMYIAEMSTNKRDRGKNVGCYELLLACGTAFAAASDAMLRPNWRAMMLVVVPFAIALMIFSIFALPESPRWLISRNENEKALEILQRIRVRRRRQKKKVAAVERAPVFVSVNADSEEIDALIEEEENVDGEEDRYALNQVDAIAQTIDMDSSSSSSSSSIFTSAKSLAVKMSEIKTNPNAYAAAKVMVSLAAFNQLSGSTSVIAYAPSLLSGAKGANFDSVEHSTTFAIIVTLAKLLGVIVGVYLVDINDEENTNASTTTTTTTTTTTNYNKTTRGGRVFLLFNGGIASSVSLFVAAIGVLSSEVLTICGLCSFIFFFSASWAPAFWVLVSESFENNHKEAAITICVSALFFFGSIADFVFLPMLVWNECFALIVVALVMLFGSLYAKTFLLESSGKTLREIQENYATTTTHTTHTTTI
jgi:MFS family permease